ncbi:unnamed protein product [Ilex paraguariensis]|uniref:Uncharacterized protein n=1 Tax=Ilex paraguariensis TaxID=185542 RepID=A0ABC8QSN7_9AQUA
MLNTQALRSFCTSNFASNFCLINIIYRSIQSSDHVQQKVISITKPVLVNAVHSLFSEDFHRKKVLNVADLGCAAGPNTFSVILTVKESLEAKCKDLNCQPPELEVYLNDLPNNDFNLLFKDLSRLGEDQKSDVLLPCFVMGAPGSFYGRLIPRSWLHLVHSSSSVHWLSQFCMNLRTLFKTRNPK